MSSRTYYWADLADDERHAIANGFGCGLCLDFGYLSGVGPCPRCKADEHAEQLLDIASAQVGATWAEEHEEWEGAA